MPERYRTADRLARALISPATLWIVSLGLAGLCAWNGRAEMNPDGLSYLDMASQTVVHGPGELVNGYWSPGYPAVISVALAMLRPGPAREVLLLHGVNLAIFAAALWSFGFFLKSMRSGIRKLHSEIRRPENTVDSPFFVLLAYAVFLWFSLKDTGMAAVTPDLMIAALAFLSGGIVWRIASGIEGGNRSYVLLGAMLGLAFLFKAAAFIVGFALIAFLYLIPPTPFMERRRLALTCLVFLAVSLPWAAAVSLHSGTRGIGEAGRLNYIWYVEHPELTPYLGWAGSFGTLYPELHHPPRMLMSDPVVLEFATPLAGTDPLWYDPSYWWQGAKVLITVPGLFSAAARNLRVLVEWALRMAPLILGALILLFLRWREQLTPVLRRALAWQLLWPLAACAVYLPVHVETRFLAAFFALFWIALYAGLLSSNGTRAPLVCALVTAALLLPFAADSVRVAVWELRNPLPESDQIAADALHSMGLKPGARLATVGVDFRAFYARRARLRTVAYVDVPPGTSWRLPAADFERVKTALVSAGIQALVARDRTDLPNPREWSEIDLGRGKLPVLMLPRLSDRP